MKLVDRTITDLVYKDECYQIIGAAQEVHRVLGPGFLEAVYQEALAIEFKEKGIPFIQEMDLTIIYKEHTLNKKYTADFVCYNKIIVETKALKQISTDNESQLLNYLTATKFRLGILINFGESSLKFKRIIK